MNAENKMSYIQKKIFIKYLRPMSIRGKAVDIMLLGITFWATLTKIRTINKFYRISSRTMGQNYDFLGKINFYQKLFFIIVFGVDRPVYIVFYCVFRLKSISFDIFCEIWQQMSILFQKSDKKLTRLKNRWKINIQIDSCA